MERYIYIIFLKSDCRDFEKWSMALIMDALTTHTCQTYALEQLSLTMLFGRSLDIIKEYGIIV